jgi:hypothetical protein
VNRDQKYDVQGKQEWFGEAGHWRWRQGWQVTKCSLWAKQVNELDFAVASDNELDEKQGI